MKRPVDRRPLQIGADERRTLSQWAEEPEVSAEIARRARVILSLADGCANVEAAHRCGVSEHLAGRWRRRFEAERLTGLLDRPRAGPPPTIDSRLLIRIRSLTLEADPPAGGRWTSRSLAQALGVSQSSIVRAWRALEVGYTRSAPFDLGTPPPGIWGESEVAGMYLAPPERLFAVRMRKGAPRRADPAGAGGVPDPVRSRVLKLVAEVERAAAEVDRGQRIVEAWRFLDGLAAASPAPWEVHLLATGDLFQATAILRRWLRQHPRFHVHRASANRTWPESVERWCDVVFSAQGVRMRHRPAELQAALGGWLERDVAAGAFAWVPPAGAPGRAP